MQQIIRNFIKFDGEGFGGKWVSNSEEIGRLSSLDIKDSVRSKADNSRMKFRVGEVVEPVMSLLEENIKPEKAYVHIKSTVVSGEKSSKNQLHNYR